MRSIKPDAAAIAYTAHRSTGNDSGLKSISIALSGSGGNGVMTAGELLLDAAARAGYYGCMARSFGPQIRGGEAAALLRLSDEPVAGPDDAYDLLVALDWGNIDRFAEEIPLTQHSRVVTDPGHGQAPALIVDSGARTLEVALGEIAKSVAGGRANLVALGLIAAAIGIPPAAAEASVRARFAPREARVLEGALGALRAGAETGIDPGLVALPPPAPRAGARWNISGNEAVGLGAVRGGIRFAAAYPITPATDMLEWLAGALPRAGGTLVQAEDELASINMCLGASFGGVPAFTATSGPGLSLMMETIGLAVASETPAVIVDVMRGGPATGIPTKSEQTDLNIAVYGLHGDAPHPVLAPTGIADSIFTTQWAAQLAERLQVPVIVLSDQGLAQSRTITDAPDAAPLKTERTTAEPEPTDTYRRYRATGDGVSPAALPGTPYGMHTAGGLAHDETGHPSARAADHRVQLDKRRDKLSHYHPGADWAVIEGDGALAVITWGSATRSAREAVRRLGEAGLATRLIAIRLLSPPQPAAMATALAGVEAALVVEHNHDGQFYKLLRADYDLPVPLHACHQPGPLPLRPGFLAERMRQHHPQAGRRHQETGS